jgi:cathepsin B
MRSLLFCVVLASFLAGVLASAHVDQVKRDGLVKAVNHAKRGWEAHVNPRFQGKPFSYTRRLLGVKDVNPATRLPYHVHTGYDMSAIPASFDSRTAWPECPSIGEIRDQSDCGSCWAFGAVEAATDRICIETKGASKPHLSAEDLVGCCSSCGMGCDGGDPSAAWQWFTQTGVVTGGNFNDSTWCAAYSLPNCDHHTTGKYGPCSSTEYPTPACPSSCDQGSSYSVAYTQDKHVFATSYSVGSTVDQIQTEIMTNGPVEAAFTVYADFESYKGGVYSHVTGEELGGHAVKILGWGTDATGGDYWLVANSWNEDWGEQGFFRIKRGTDECGIEDYIVGGLFTNSKKAAHKRHH